MGTVVIALTALFIDHRIAKRYKIDDALVKEMEIERKIGFLDIALVISGFILQVISKIQ